MSRDDEERRGLTRRDFLQTTGLGALAMGGASLTTTATRSSAAAAEDRPYNIIFILTDQERYFDPAEFPSGLALPGRARLQRRGELERDPLRDSIAAVSAGVVGGEVLLDLPYEEDARAEVDMNVVATGSGRFVEIQGTGEEVSKPSNTGSSGTSMIA